MIEQQNYFTEDCSIGLEPGPPGYVILCCPAGMEREALQQRLKKFPPDGVMIVVQDKPYEPCPANSMRKHFIAKEQEP